MWFLMEPGNDPCILQDSAGYFMLSSITEFDACAALSIILLLMEPNR
jgi:hypothetical protein